MSLERDIHAMNFAVTADFAYWRRVEGGQKDFSVDVRGIRPIGTPWVTEQDNVNPGASIHGSWDVLLECKYRNPAVKWLFAPSSIEWFFRKTHFFV